MKIYMVITMVLSFFAAGSYCMQASGEHPRKKEVSAWDDAIGILINLAFGIWAAILLY